MAQATLENVRQGWQVYAGSDRVGEVSYVDRHEFGVRSGRIVRHEYRVPMEYVSDAADGVVDLKIDRELLERLEPAK